LLLGDKNTVVVGIRPMIWKRQAPNNPTKIEN
jgi:hypothetical protein